MRLFRPQSNAVNADDVSVSTAQHRGWYLNGDHVDVISSKTIPTALQLSGVGVTSEDRTDEPIKAYDVEVNGSSVKPAKKDAPLEGH
jgi:hypothetical protein